MTEFEIHFHELRAENAKLRDEVRKYRNGSAVLHLMHENEVLGKKLDSCSQKKDYYKEKADECRNRCHEQALNVSAELGDGCKICEENKTGCIVPSIMRILRKQIKDNENLRQQLEEKDVKIQEQRAVIESLTEETKRIPELEDKIRKQQAQLSKDSTNSSQPSSTDKPWKNKEIPNSRTKSDKKPGAQPGHEGHHAKPINTSDPNTESCHVETPDEILNNPNLRPTGRQVHKIVYDIEFNVVARDYYADEYIDKKTGKRIHAKFPENLINDVNYGESIKAFAWILVNVCNVSISKTADFFKQMSNGKLVLSEGFISSLSKQFKDKTEEERNEIFKILQKSHVMYTDTTFSNVNGDLIYVNVYTDKNHVLYIQKPCKGLEAAKETPLEYFLGVLVHDHDRSYYHFGSEHQECLAHILRYLKGASELEKNLTWHTKMHSLIQEMIHTFKENDGNLTEEQIRSFIERYEQILQLAEKEYIENPPGKCSRDGIKLFSRLKKYQEQTLFFLSHPEVDYTNNVSEKMLRKVKTKQNVSGAFRSEDGLDNFLNSLSFIEEARLQNQNIYDKAKEVFSRS